MDIHKPRPWHGLRGFLKEYLIIVVGVATALAGEAGVEWLHWRHEVKATEEALLNEVRISLLYGYDRLATAPCRGARISELTDLLAAPGPVWKGSTIGKFGKMPVVYEAPVRPWLATVWSSALASGVLDHMPRQRVRQYALQYAGFDQIRQWQGREEQARTRLTALAFDRTLTPAEKAEYLNVLGELNWLNVLMAITAKQRLDDAAEAGFMIKASTFKKHWRGNTQTCVRHFKIPLAPE